MVFKFNRGEFYTATPELRDVEAQQILDHGFEINKQSNTLLLFPKELRDKHDCLLKKYLLERRKNMKLNLGEVVTLFPSNIEKCKIEGVMRRTPTYWYAVSQTKLQKLCRNYFDLDSFIYSSPKEVVLVSQYEICTRDIRYSVESNIFRIPFESQKQHLRILDQRRKQEPILIIPKTRTPCQSGSGSKRQKIAVPSNNELAPISIDQKSVIGNVIAVYGDTNGVPEVWYYILERDFEGIVLERANETTFEPTAHIDPIEKTTVLDWDVRCKIVAGGNVIVPLTSQQNHRILLEKTLKNIQEKQAGRVSAAPVEQKNDVGNVIAVYENIERSTVVRYYIIEKDLHGILLAKTDETAFNRTSTVDLIYESRVLSWKVKHTTGLDGTILIDAKEQQLYRNLVKPGMKWTDPAKDNLGSADSLSVDRDEPLPVQHLAPETMVQ
jgi:hypothetical protein